MKVTLLCQCVLEMDVLPNFGDRLYCHKHEDMSNVMHIEQWKAKCRDCKYTRRTSDFDTAAAIAAKHADKLGHVLIVQRPDGKPDYDVVPATIALYD